MSQSFQVWTAAEEAKLMTELARYPVPAIARMHNRSVRAIEMRIEHLIRKHSKSCSPSELAERFHKSLAEIDQILHHQTPAAAAASKSDPISPQLDRMEALLTKIYKKQKTLECAIESIHPTKKHKEV